ncbi:MAG: DeoR family transcriptional regulator [Patescibacteria group bacterium]
MLTERQERLLEFVIRTYVRTAEPVGSAVVCAHAGMDVSPATIRNDMQVLEELGFLTQPHTSAGRVPTDRAYRWLVDELVKRDEHAAVPVRDRRRIDALVGEAGLDSRLLSRHLAATLADLLDSAVIAHIRDYDDFYKFGLSELMAFPEFQRLERTMQVMHFVDRFDDLFGGGLDDALFGKWQSEPYRIFIGRENPVRTIQDEAVIVARYRLPGNMSGLLTIIGPMRMDYRRNLALLAYATDAVSRAAEESDS